MIALSATAADSEANFKLMKETVSSVIDRYGIGKVRYSVILFGNTIDMTYGFRDNLTHKEELMGVISKLPKRMTGRPAVGAVLRKVVEIFNSGEVRTGSTKAFIVIMDNTSGLNPDNLRTNSRPLHEMSVIVVPVVAGNVTNTNALAQIAQKGRPVISVPRTKEPELLGEKIMKEVFEGIKTSNSIYCGGSL